MMKIEDGKQQLLKLECELRIRICLNSLSDIGFLYVWIKTIRGKRGVYRYVKDFSSEFGDKSIFFIVVFIDNKSRQ